MQNKNNGFSLIELSVVLVIIAIISGITISIASTQIQFAKISNAQKTLTNAKIALTTFKEKTGRLPCPADPTLAPTNANYGLEVAGCNLAVCPAGVICPDAVQVQGVIPFKTINLLESSAYDSWNNKLSYIVDKDLTTIATANNDGRIPVFDANGNEITASTVIGKATYILLSHGSDGKGAYKKNGTLHAACAGSESDVENCDGDAMIISRQIAATNNVATTADFYEDYLEVENQMFKPQIIITFMSDGILKPGTYTIDAKFVFSDASNTNEAYIYRMKADDKTIIEQKLISSNKSTSPHSVDISIGEGEVGGFMLRSDSVEWFSHDKPVNLRITNENCNNLTTTHEWEDTLGSTSDNDFNDMIYEFNCTHK